MATAARATPLVGVVMGSNSDWDVMQHACNVLKEFEVPFEARVVSAHRMPATFAIGEAGAANAGLFAVAMLAAGDADLARRLAQYRATQTEKARNMTLPL